MIVLDVNIILVYLACVIFLFLMGKVFILPLKTITKIIGNSILGAILIFVINVIGKLFEFHIGLNIGTAILTGILGLPRSNFINFVKTFFIVLGNNMKFKVVQFKVKLNNFIFKRKLVNYLVSCVK